MQHNKAPSYKKTLKNLMVFLIIFTFSSFIFLPLMVFYGPFKNIKSSVVGMSMNSSKFQFVARLFLNENTISKILSENAAIDPTQKGEKIKALNFGQELTNRIEAYNISGSGYKGKMLVITDPKTIEIGLSQMLPKAGETISSIAQRCNAIAAINAGGFMDNGWVGTGGEPIGFIIHNKKLVYSQISNEKVKQDTAAFTDDGMLIVGRHSIEQLREYGVKEAVSFGPPLIVNGKKTIKKGDGGWGIAPRTAIGQRENGEVLMLAIDGRSINSLGATLKDIQDILYKYGAINAVNLDGGSSTTMYFNGGVINTPSDRLGERAIPSAFMVIPGKAGQ